ncbi:MAG: phosphoribosylformylglycinamidine synthase subunit PurL [Candidatus Eremiobacteraeota bacterium]|nr:phosphoribosylformylglycinamidine synthase subunit PurL [Candidatus Eremiobacteraeota bacterium]
MRDVAAIEGLALSDDEMRRVAEGLGREPTLVEAFAFDAQWSEHCSYKSSRGFLQTLPTRGERVVLGPGEDAGALHLGVVEGERYAVVVAHESHNHPSQVVPFEGAATGIGGVVRDVLCMGAQVVGLADPLRFGTNATARAVAQGVVDGIAAYGNAIGVPNLAGDVAFDPRFDDNVLVNVVALGIVRERDLIHSRAPAGSAGWDIVLVGKATDRSGFGGAAFSSLQLDAADAEANKGAVQVPDAFLKSVIMRASYRVFEVLRDEGIVAGFKDLGAGGIMGCTAELVAAGGFGAHIELERVSIVDPDLPPAVIAVGETQERMCWIVPPAFTPRLLAIYNEEFGLPRVARGAAANVIGRVADEGRYVLTHRGTTVMDVPIDFLTAGIRYERAYRLPARHEARAIARNFDLKQILPRVLAHRDVCSRAPIFERYDAVVRGATAIPRGYADAGVVVAIPGAPLAVAVAVAGNPRYGALDPHYAGAQAVIEAHCNVAAVGARPIGLTDCLNFGDADDPEQFGEFVAAVGGLSEAAAALGTPFVSGNVSFYNTTSRGAIPASPIVACIGAIDDVSTIAAAAFTTPGAALFLVGPRDDALGGSVVASFIGGERDALPPLDYDALRRMLSLVREGFASNLILSAHDVSDGGLAVAVCEMAFAGGLGATLEPPENWAGQIGTAGAWFGERSGFAVEVVDQQRFEALAHAHGVLVQRVGAVRAERVLRFGDVAFDVDVLRAAWAAPLLGFYDADGER